MNWKDALAYCQNLNLGGHKDWQLPSIREFQTLMDYDKNSSSGPYIDAIFKGNPNKWYWSRTPRVGSASDAWRVSFYAGISYYLVSNSGRVRCFRPGPF